MSHTPQSELAPKIEVAKKFVEINGIYYHYKLGKEFPYKVLVLALLEANEEIAVVYAAQYGDHLVWVRPLSSWLSEVETEAGKVKRFIKVKP